MMMVDASVMNPSAGVAMTNMGDMGSLAQINPMSNLINMGAMNAIPLSSYDGMTSIQHMGTIQQTNHNTIITPHSVEQQGNASVSIPIPITSMNVSVNMNTIPPINLTAIPAMSMNSLQLPVGMNTRQQMNMNVMDTQRN